MTLDDFESSVSPKILQRGRVYFQENAVDELEKVSRNKWEATVTGSEEYLVEIKLKEREVQSWECDCPFEAEDVCKHVVAVLYALQEEVTLRPATGAKSKSRTERLKELLGKLSPEDLHRFVLEAGKSDKHFADAFLLFFADKDPQFDVGKHYRGIIRNLVKEYSDHGFMAYRETIQFSREVSSILDHGERLVQANNLRDAQIIAELGCEELLKVLNVCDDSNGSAGACIEQAISIMKAIAGHSAVAPGLLERILDWIEAQLQNPDWMNYGDFGYHLLEVHEEICFSFDPDRFLRLVDLMLPVSGKGWSRDYRMEALSTQKHQFLLRAGRTKEAEALLEKNIHMPAFREAAVLQAIGDGAFGRARKLLEEGILLSRQANLSGLTLKWENYVLQIARKEQDIPTIRRIAHHIAFSNIQLDEPHYLLWKSTYSREEWPEVLNAFLQEERSRAIASARQWGDPGNRLFERLWKVYVLEEEWEQLLQLIPAQPGLPILKKVRTHLMSRYPQKMLDLYLAAFEQAAGRASNRTQYAQLVQDMLELRKEFRETESAINQLASSLRETYARRPAMVEELGRLVGAGNRK